MTEEIVATPTSEAIEVVREAGLQIRHAIVLESWECFRTQPMAMILHWNLVESRIAAVGSPRMMMSDQPTDHCFRSRNYLTRRLATSCQGQVSLCAVLSWDTRNLQMHLR